MLRNKKGFTLIEMLVVIAIIAVLVSIIIPTVSASTSKAKAAADAANLRSVMGQLNGVLAEGDQMDAVQAQGLQTAESRMYPGAKMLILYCNPGFIDAYYMIDGQYYGLNYFSTVAQYNLDAAEGISTAKPVPAAGSGLVYEWYEAGVGAFDD